MTRYRVTFERVGRHTSVPPLEVEAADAFDLEDKVLRHVRPMLASKEAEVGASLTQLDGQILAGGRPAGNFTLEAVA
jgi:hypothetical protein